MRASEIRTNFFRVGNGDITLNEFKALGYLPEEIKEASSCGDVEFLHLVFQNCDNYLEMARFLIFECRCDPMATCKWSYFRVLTRPGRSVFLLFCKAHHYRKIRACLEMGIRWLPNENDKVAHKFAQHCGPMNNLHAALDYGLCITDKTHPHYPLYAHRLGTRAVSIALLSTWKTRCPSARLLGRDMLALVAKMVWTQRFTV